MTTLRRRQAQKMAAVKRPCPRCGRMIRPSNLERHIAAKHKRER